MRWIPDPTPLADAVRAAIPDDVLNVHVLNAEQCRELRALAAPDNATLPVLESYSPGGQDVSALLLWFDDTFRALAALRSGSLQLDGHRDPETLSLLQDSLTAVVHRLEPRLSGLANALIRAHHAAGGTPAELATAMDTTTHAAQKRSIRVRMSTPNAWEEWAAGEGTPSEHPATDVRPGWTLLDDNGKRHQVQAVSVYGDGVTEVDTGGRTTGFAYDPGEKVQATPRTIPLQETTGVVGIGTPEGQIPVTTYSRARRRVAR